MESHSINETPQASNYATNYDTNYNISHCTDHNDDGNKNAFLLYIGTNTNMSSYLHNLYEYDENRIWEWIWKWNEKYINL